MSGTSYPSKIWKYLTGGDETLRFPIPESNGALPVNIQDQTTEVLDLYLSEKLSEFTLTTAASLDDTSFTGDVDNGFTPVVGEMVCLKEEGNFYQGLISGVVANGGDNYTLSVDIPSDASFSVSGGCSVRNINLAVDGSVTPRSFNVSPGLLTPGIEWDITRILMSFLGTGYSTPPDDQPDDAGFGAMAALTKGIYLRHANGRVKNVFLAKTNADLRARTYDVSYTSKSKDGFYGVGCRRTFSGQDKNGVTLRLEAKDPAMSSGMLEVVVQDDLTDMESFTLIAQGHFVGN